LQQNLHCPNLVMLDAFLYLPRQQQNVLDEFKLQHIPGAQFFDVDEIADLNSLLGKSLGQSAKLLFY
jgi:thiosulfate/3-mercaptopyruvate sulfurtransferase